MIFDHTSRILLLIWTITAPTTASPLSPRDSSLGLYFAPNQTQACANSIDQIITAINQTRILSNSAIAALANPSQNPSSYFFPSSFASIATEVFNAALDLTLPIDQITTKSTSMLNPIELYCQDLYNLCDTTAPGNNNLADRSSTQIVYGYIPDDANPAPGFGTAQIVICPAMLTLPSNPPSCTGTPGQATIGWAFLRTFVRLRSVQFGYSKFAKDEIVDYAPGVEQSHGLLEGNLYAQNADNFAELATLAFDLGTTGQGMSCPGDWSFT